MQVLLQPNREVLAKRVQERAALGSHFMPASLLESQLALVEMDPTAYTYGIHQYRIRTDLTVLQSLSLTLQSTSHVASSMIFISATVLWMSKLLFGQVKGRCLPSCPRSSFDDVAVHDCQLRHIPEPYKDAQNRLLWR